MGLTAPLLGRGRVPPHKDCLSRGHDHWRSVTDCVGSSPMTAPPMICIPIRGPDHTSWHQRLHNLLAFRHSLRPSRRRPGRQVVMCMRIGCHRYRLCGKVIRFSGSAMSSQTSVILPRCRAARLAKVPLWRNIWPARPARVMRLDGMSDHPLARPKSPLRLCRRIHHG